MCRVPALVLDKEAFAKCQVTEHWTKNLKKNKKPFVECRTAGHLVKADGRWPPSRQPPLPTVKVCREPGTRQRQICRRPFFAECRWVWHSRKIVFAECPTESTRQSNLHSAKQPCPVVNNVCSYWLTSWHVAVKRFVSHWTSAGSNVCTTERGSLVHAWLYKKKKRLKSRKVQRLLASSS
jgi:hypothetical protein